jgi:hypothetical protein
MDDIPSISPIFSIQSIGVSTALPDSTLLMIKSGWLDSAIFILSCSDDDINSIDDKSDIITTDIDMIPTCLTLCLKSSRVKK